MDNGLVIEVDPERFEEMVAAALDGLPEELGRLMSNHVYQPHRTGGSARPNHSDPSIKLAVQSWQGEDVGSGSGPVLRPQNCALQRRPKCPSSW